MLSLDLEVGLWLKGAFISKDSRPGSDGMGHVIL